MKKSSPVRATHVNHGTAIPREALQATPQRGREFRHPTLHSGVETSDATAVGGLALAARLMATLRAPQTLDAALSLFKVHRPFTESDHVLTHVYNLFTGGQCIEDIADLQHSVAARRILGATRLPDPTTAGDFLRRFRAPDIAALDAATDALHRAVWKKRWGRRTQPRAIIDLDSHIHHIYGHQKEGADFTYQGGFGFHPLVVSLAGTNECLRIVNRPGNLVSADGAHTALADVAPLVQSRFRRTLVRGDSAFATQTLFETCATHGFDFAFVAATQRNYAALADTIPAGEWQPFRAHEPDASPDRPRRTRGPNRRRARARARGKRDLKLLEQWIAEVPYRPTRSDTTYRLIVRRQRIEESNQGELFERFRYRYVLTNLPPSTPMTEVMRLTYERCDQENMIEQLQNGIAAMRMPTGQFDANAAWFGCARLAHNLKAWLGLLVLPAEVMRWEWKRFRKAFVQVAARVVRTAGQVHVRISNAHRFADTLVAGLVQLQT